MCARPPSRRRAGRRSGARRRCGRREPRSQAGEFTLQHQCGSTTAPWGYQIAPQLRAIAITPVTEQGVDWTRNGVKQSRLSPHVEAADYIFHGTFPGSPDGTTITYSDHYAFRHGAGGGGNVDISIKGAFTLTGNRA